MKKRYIGVLFSTILFVNVVYGQSRIVIPDDYLSIQEGISASVEGDTILVKPDTYYENINFNGKNIVLGSFYLTTEDTSYISSTIIDGSNNTLQNGGATVAFSSGEDTTAILTGFTLTGGTGYRLGNEPDNDGTFHYGGGLYINSSAPTISYTIIKNNKVNASGAGIALNNSNAKLENLRIVSNEATNTSSDLGGGVYLLDSNPNLKNLLIAHNQSATGGGLSIYSSQVEMNNNIIVDNKAVNSAGGVYIFDSDVTIKHSLIIHNKADIEVGGGFWIGSSNTSIINSIIYSNIDGSGANSISGNAEVSYSIVEGGWTGTNNQDIDPLLVYDENEKFNLSNYSPAIGSGSSLISTETDFNGNPRPNPSGSNPDIGAYENELAEPLPFPAPEQVEIIDNEFSTAINWSYDTTAFGSLIEGFEIYRGDQEDNYSLLTTVADSIYSYVDSTVITGSSYYYLIKMKSKDNRENDLSEPFQIEVVDLPPAIPDTLLVDLSDFDRVTLNWNLNNEPDLDGYNIYRSKNSGDFQLLDQIGKTNTFEDSDLVYQTIYRYAVSSVDTNGNESDQIEATIKTGDAVAPPIPQGLVANEQPDMVLLNWNAVEVSDLAGYMVYRGTDSTNVELLKELGKTLSYTDSSVTNAVTYYYRISAVDSAGSGEYDPAHESDLSFAVSAIPIDLVGPEQTTIATINSSNSTVQLSWQEITVGDLAGYRIYRSTSDEPLVKLDSVDAGITSYVDDSVNNGIVYNYAVSGVDTLNNEGELSEPKTAMPINALPKAVSIDDYNFQAVQDSVVTVNLSAEGSSDSDGRIDSTLWFIDNTLISNQFEFNFEARQGTSQLSLVVKDNDGGTDTTPFYVHVSSNFRSFDDQNAGNAGISLIGDNYLFLPLAGGVLQILDASFEDRFDLSVGGEIRSVSSIAPDTTVYLASTDRVVYSFDRRGLPLWNTPLGGELQATPTIDTQRDLLYVGVSNSNLFAVDRATGDVIWSYRLENPITQPGVIIENRYLLIITERGNASYFDLDGEVTGQELSPSGSINIADSLSTSPAIDSEGYIYASTASGTLVKFEFREDLEGQGQVIWETQTNGRFNVSPVIGYEGTIYVGASDSSMYAFDGTDGTIKWTFKTDDAITTTATINEFGVIYVGDESGKLYAIDEFGNLLWYYIASQSIGNATAYSDGNILFSTVDGQLLKIYDGWRFGTSSSKMKGAEGLENKSPQWGTYQGNNRRSGNAQDQVSTSSENVTEEIPNEYSLSQNYPNPFNPTTLIQYSIPQATEVRLEVFNMLGQKVATLIDGKQSAGWHTATFNASSLSSGFYIYHIRAGEFVSTKKLMLIK